MSVHIKIISQFLLLSLLFPLYAFLEEKHYLDFLKMEQSKINYPFILLLLFIVFCGVCIYRKYFFDRTLKGFFKKLFLFSFLCILSFAFSILTLFFLGVFVLGAPF
ncbi:hypothetical protein DFR44_1421 [Hydromonas duriensis]|uniref:Uncharacterized protein n=1 Tax=Hydromonas duriensis TaxID=1527608 RepID=A0A4R6XZW2_9BURK|nr:hypothetical protein DFR44_1421 [Hydromonas duriensis]